MDKVLIIVGDATETVDTLYPYYRVIEAGFQPVVAAPEKRRYQMVMHEVKPGWTITKEWEGYTIQADVAFSEVNEEEYLGIFFSGGRAPEYIRYDEDLVRITRFFFETNKPVGCVCHGVEIPAYAGCVKGRRMATVAKCKFDLEVCGGTFVDEPCVIDGNLVSGRTYHDHGYYVGPWIKMLEQARAAAGSAAILGIQKGKTMNSKKMHRRGFLAESGKSALALGGGVTILANSKSARGAPANDKVSLAMIGVRGRGNGLAGGFLDRDDCAITHVCDVDKDTGMSRIEAYAERQGGRQIQYFQDYRKLLDDKSVDAVVIATPDHWHAPLAIYSCQAGKDVYVEKPPSHNPWEGQQMIKAARKYNQIVQVGTQNRSAPYNLEAKKFIDEGKLGRIHLCRVFNMKSQGNFKLPPDSSPPPGFNWDIWQGPAPARGYNEKIRHGGWHHLWDYCGGDAANDGVHQLDLARWLVGVDVPKSVHCTGGRFDQPGDAESPDTQVASYDFDNLVMTFELTLYTPYMLKTDGGIRDSDMLPYWPQNATRIEIYGSDGVMYMGRHGGGWEVYIRPQSREPVVKASRYARFPDPEHKQNFLACIRSRKLPNADVLEGHRSALLVHYANISYRCGGEKLVIDPQTEQFVDCPDAMKLFKREYRDPYVVPEEV